MEEFNEAVLSKGVGFAKTRGVKAWIVDSYQVSSVTNMTVKSYSAQAGPNGLKLVTVGSVAEAIEWLKLQS